jgi:hypothetical protein
MDKRQFDNLVRRLGAGQSRRAVLKGMLGFGGTIVATSAMAPGRADAARRGFSGPTFPCVPQCDGATCGPDGCGRTCACARGLVCIPDTQLCGWPCVETQDCDGACLCDLAIGYCFSNQSEGNCSVAADCPAGTVCTHIETSGTCRIPCTSAS